MPFRSIFGPLVLLVLLAGCKSEEALQSVNGEGELRTPGEVRFEVRPLSGPGSMGPHEISPASAPVLEHVQSYLSAHSDADRLRIECTVAAMKMSRSPDPAWGADLAHQIARRLVARGIDCKRLDPVGLLDPDPEAPAERVRFFVGEIRQPLPGEAHSDACKER